MAVAEGFDSVPQASMRFGPTRYPLLHPSPMLIPVLDANALLIMGCDMVKRRREHDMVTRLAVTGRGNPHMAAHIPGEVSRHLPRLAAENGVSRAAVGHVLDYMILPSARLVDLEIRDHLGPGTARILRTNPELPKKNRGDPDDAPTMALAELLAPAVIISQDSVFTRFGFAGAAAEWIPIAKDLLRLVGVEANLTDAAWIAEVALRLLIAAGQGLAFQALRHPWLASAAVASALWICHKHGYLDKERWRESAARLWELAQPVIGKANVALLDHTRIRQALVIVEALPSPVPEQLAARHLARCGHALTPAELRDALRERGHDIAAAQLERDMRAHRGFIREPGNRYTLGRLGQLSPGRLSDRPKAP